MLADTSALTVGTRSVNPAHAANAAVARTILEALPEPPLAPNLIMGPARRFRDSLYSREQVRSQRRDRLSIGHDDATVLTPGKPSALERIRNTT